MIDFGALLIAGGILAVVIAILYLWRTKEKPKHEKEE
jgi:small neutral amino acid transporter SnatA (MarC family)